jgi:putative transposase
LQPHQVAQRTKQLQQEARDGFEAGASFGAAAAESHEVQLYEQIGRLKMELEWLKKKLGGLVP